ncbi:hypothetical protein ACFL3C_02105 [Patescibacteria group bacterium]
MLEKEEHVVEAAVDEEGCTLYFEPGHYQIPAADFPELNQRIKEQVVKGFEDVSFVKKNITAPFAGYSVASESDYDCETASYSTRTTLIEVNGNRYFVVYNYPGSSGHRKADTGCRTAWGEKAFKATEEDWRETFLKRSLIPATKLQDNERVVECHKKAMELNGRSQRVDVRM